MVLNNTPMLYGITPGTLAAEKAVIMNKAKEADSLVMARQVVFTEDGSGTTFTGSVTIPAGSMLIDVIVHNDVLWADGTSAALVIGDAADPNGIWATIDLKATDLLADESIGFGYAGGQEGADVDGGDAAGDHLRRRFLATERVISGVVTTGAQDGSAGVTRMIVVYVKPSSSDAVSA